ncbi:hypothetical protein LCGC14_2207200 [marine sediment metagenome]|uniref:PD(D/E)XK endonuclease domain-containing protein n=1 Tax=marine sediment metagenome TaxID=412755 RepID=A0A0F9E2D5_9ZZZZ
MSLSQELQIGKAGEHLVCCDLITKGISAFLADQGLPYDVVIDDGVVGLKRVSVKTCTKKGSYGKAKEVYRFSLRSAKGACRAIRADSIDYVAFVFLDRRSVEYLPVSEITSPDGFLKQCIDFKSEGGTKYVIGKFSTI